MRVGRGAGNHRVVVNEFSVLGVPGGVVVPFSELGNTQGRKGTRRTSLVVQWLRRHTSIAGGTGLILGPGTKILHARKVITNKSNVFFMWFRIIIFFHLLDTFARYRLTMRKLRLRKVMCLSGASRMSESTWTYTCGASKPLFFLPSYSTLRQGSVLRQQAFANGIKQKHGPGQGRKSEKGMWGHRASSPSISCFPETWGSRSDQQQWQVGASGSGHEKVACSI